MRVLVGCEHTGAVRDAFRDRGHEAYSVDLLPDVKGSPFHYTGDVREMLVPGRWDLAVFHPPCTYLANSGVRWLYRADGQMNMDRWVSMEEGAEFFEMLRTVDIPRIAVENPVMHKHARALIGAGPDQTIQPWMFGHTEQKATCLWLKGLPKLVETDNVKAQMMQLPV